MGICSRTEAVSESGFVLRVRALTGESVAPGSDHGIGRHLLGKAPTACIRLHGSDVASHQVAVVLEPTGQLRIRRLAGGARVHLDGTELGPGDCTVPADTLVVLQVGATGLSLRSVVNVAVGRVHEDSPRVVRSARSPHAPTTVQVRMPTIDPVAVAAPSAMSLVAAGVGLVGGLVMASVLGTWLFALFALLGALTATLTWALTRLRSHRQRRQTQALVMTARREMLAEVLRSARMVATAAHAQAPEVIDVRTARDRGLLWVRRPGHGDAYDVTVGRSGAPLPVEFDGGSGSQPAPEDYELVYSLVAEVNAQLGWPEVVALDAAPQQVVGVTGPMAGAVVRSMVVQLAVGTGPADLRLVALSEHPERYAWLRDLPHSSVSGAVSDASAVIDMRAQAAAAHDVLRLDDGDPRRIVVVTDHAEGLTFRTAPLRRLLDRHRAITVLVDLPSGTPVPAICAQVISTDLSHSLGISATTATDVMADLVGLEDPEDERLAATTLPVQVDLDALLGDLRTPAQIRARWVAGGADPAPAALIGCTADAMLEVDLVADGPHGLVAGTTGSGKSELLRSLVLSLAARVAPAHLQFVLIDYKGGSTFDAAADLPHTVGLVTDLDEGRAERALVSLDAELRRRERLLRTVGAADLTAYRAQAGVAPLARLVVVIDEFAALAHELPDFLTALVGVAQRGRSLGIHLLLATQRPAGVIDDAIRANTDLRIALRLNDVSDARDVVGDDRPVGFPRGVPGRSLLRLGADEAAVFQAASSAAIMRARVEAITAASDGYRPAHRPWLPALDDLVVHRGDGGHSDDLGTIDDPEAQTHRRLLWDRAGGLAVIGALGSGTTTTLIALVHQMLRADAAVVFVIDGSGDPRLTAVGSAAGCAAVVALHERERIDRMLGLWCDEIDRRRHGDTASAFDTPRPDWVLAVDDVMALRRSMDDGGTPWASGTISQWERILAEGPGVGLVVLASVNATGASAAAVVSRFAQRWVHHLEDPGDGPMCGLGSARVPPDVPGRVRIVASGLEAQIWPPGPLPDGPSRWTVPHIGSLGSQISSEALRRAARAAPAVTGVVPIGLGYDHLGADGPEVPDGDHLVVLGGPRSGRTTALVQFAQVWQQRHRDGCVQVVLGRRGASPLTDVGSQLAEPIWTDAPGMGARLVLVDDADRLGEGDVGWERWVQSAPIGTTIIAAARPEMLRGMFGHWTTAVRRSRTALIMTLGAEAGADVLGAVIPRYHPLRPRPGLAWVVDAAGTRLIQIAVPDVNVPDRVSAEQVDDYP